MLIPFLSGAVVMAFSVISLLFLSSARKTGERIFVFFSLSFGILAGERLLLVFLNPQEEFTPLIYVIRLLAFILIATGIVMKNQAR